jgi:hypothetical protein
MLYESFIDPLTILSALPSAGQRRPGQKEDRAGDQGRNGREIVQ